MSNYLFIDIRKSDEVYSLRFDKSNNYEVYYIPMNMIRFNADIIKKHLQYKKKIYIVCNSSSRSNFIKKKYFANIPKIIVSDNLQFNKLNQGINKVAIDNITLNVNVIGDNSFNLYNVMRITQIILGTLITLIGSYSLYSLYNCKNKFTYQLYPLIILILFGIMALFNGLTSTCSLSVILVDYLN